MWRGFESQLVSGFLSFDEKRWSWGYHAFSFWKLHQFLSFFEEIFISSSFSSSEELLYDSPEEEEEGDWFRLLGVKSSLLSLLSGNSSSFQGQIRVFGTIKKAL